MPIRERPTVKPAQVHEMNLNTNQNVPGCAPGVVIAWRCTGLVPWRLENNMATEGHTPNTGGEIYQRRAETRQPNSNLWSILSGQRRALLRQTRDAIRSTGKERSDKWRLRLIFAELNRMSASELADIGLSKSDLTLEGLAIAGAKRAKRQDSVALEIASLNTRQEVRGRGD